MPDPLIDLESTIEIMLASEQADIHAQFWGFESAVDLNAWGKDAERKRMDDVASPKGFKT